MGTTLKDLVALSEAEVNALTRKDTEPYLRHHGLGLHRDLSTRKRRLVEFRQMQKDKQSEVITSNDTHYQFDVYC